MSIVLQGSTSGSITLQEPAIAGSNTINLPAASGTAILSDGSGNIQFNSGYGSVAIAYGCRAWVNFNGTGTVSIRASGNVSSITDIGTGTYQVNYSNSLSSNMCPVAMCSDDGVSNRAINLQNQNDTYNLTTSCVVTIWQSGGGSADSTGVYVAVFR